MADQTIINVSFNGPQALGVLEAVKLFLDNSIKDIISDAQGKDITKGNLNLQTKLRNDGGSATGVPYIYQLWKGRKPGKQPPTQSISQWITKKGLRGRNKKGRFITTNSLAFLIARKIGKMGTDIYLKKRPGIDMENIIEINSLELQKNLVTLNQKAIQAQISKALIAALKR